MKKLLFIIVIIAAFLRFFNLHDAPPSLTWDEASWGYNAYALGIDGHDEFGKFLPLAYIESFGDFKPPVYAYLDIFPVKIFGLNEFATRFPSAFFGVLTVLLTYFLVKEIFGKEKEELALLSSFMLAISPWHIMLSRAAFEANVANFFIVLGIFLFLKSMRNLPLLLPLSVISFVIALNTFNSARIVIPILCLILAVSFHKKLIENLKMTILSGIIGIILIIPLLLFMRTPQAQLRFNEVNIFSDIGVINRINQEVKNDGNGKISKIIHNRRFTYGVEYLRHYLDNLTPQFLFIRGDGNPKFSIQDVGQMYLWETPLFVIGFLILFRKREKYWWIVPVWLVVGILPAGFARETPHALRIESSLPTFQIISAIGMVSMLGYIWKLKNKNIKNTTAVVIAGLILINFIYFTQNYFLHYPTEYSGEWQYGYKQSVAYVSSVQNQYKHIYITESLGRPYIYYLFYMNYNPTKFRQDSSIYRETFGFVHVQRFSNLNFTDNIAKVTDSNALYISTPSEKPDTANVIKEFKLLNGYTALVAYTK